VGVFEPPVPDRECRLSDDGGRGGMGEVARGVAVDEGGKTDEIEGRALRREDDVGMVRRSAAGLEDGVEGVSVVHCSRGHESCLLNLCVPLLVKMQWVRRNGEIGLRVQHWVERKNLSQGQKLVTG